MTSRPQGEYRRPAPLCLGISAQERREDASELESTGVGDGNLDADIARSGIRRQDQRRAIVLLAAGVLADLIGQVRGSAFRCDWNDTGMEEGKTEGRAMIPLYCIVDRKQISEERVRRGEKTCDKECQKVFRRAFLLDRKERYRKAAGLPPSNKIHQRAKEQCS